MNTHKYLFSALVALALSCLMTACTIVRDDLDFTLAETLSGVWTIELATEDSGPITFDTSEFSLVLGVQRGEPSSYTLLKGGIQLPEIVISSTWTIGSNERSIILGTGANALTATINQDIPSITLDWVDDRDKTPIVYQYTLSKD